MTSLPTPEACRLFSAIAICVLVAVASPNTVAESGAGAPESLGPPFDSWQAQGGAVGDPSNGAAYAAAAASDVLGGPQGTESQTANVAFHLQHGAGVPHERVEYEARITVETAHGSQAASLGGRALASVRLTLLLDVPGPSCCKVATVTPLSIDSSRGVTPESVDVSGTYSLRVWSTRGDLPLPPTSYSLRVSVEAHAAADCGTPVQNGACTGPALASAVVHARVESVTGLVVPTPRYAVEVRASLNECFLARNSNAVLSAWMRNTGFAPDAYALEALVDGPGMSAYATPDRTDAAPGDRKSFEVNARSGGKTGDYPLRLTATSEGNPDATSSAVILLRVVDLPARPVVRDGCRHPDTVP